MIRPGSLGLLCKQIWQFAARNKAWWFVPLILVLLLLGVLIVAGQAVAPFIYTVF